ncbi:response regulator [Oligoflexus tunisiensis]|uniref:response regulator n=1 Tax=Oligoflexus tunisiensis TaxID=708132 RepID=UPI00114C8E41|nr:response regulator [Oligoflexus tunisiensis]
MKILIADDEVDFLDYMVDILDEAFQRPDITKATNGAQALHLCAESTFDLICIDYRMPVMNGLEFTRFLRREAGPNQYTGIVFISGYLDDFIIEAEALVGVYFVEKPIQAKHLMRVASLAMQKPLKVKI